MSTTPRSVWRALRPILIGAVALGVIVAASGALWHTATRPIIPQPVMRGRGGGSLGLLATWQDDGSLRIRWSPTPKTVAYHVQLSGSTGAEMQKSTTLPLLTLPFSEVATLGDITVTVDAEAASGEHTSKSGTLKSARRPRPQ